MGMRLLLSLRVGDFFILFYKKEDNAGKNITYNNWGYYL